MSTEKEILLELREQNAILRESVKEIKALKRELSAFLKLVEVTP